MDPLLALKTNDTHQALLHRVCKPLRDVQRQRPDEQQADVNDGLPDPE